MDGKEAHINRIVSIVLFAPGSCEATTATSIDWDFSAATITEASICRSYFHQRYCSNFSNALESSFGFGQGTAMTETGLEENEEYFLSVKTQAQNSFATYLYSVT